MSGDVGPSGDDELEIGPLLRAYPGLRLLPVSGERVRLAGTLSFRATAKGIDRVEDSFEVEVAVPESFPSELPTVRETGGRVPKSFHTNPDGSLCLGSRTGQRLLLVERPSALGFVESCVIPFFVSFLWYERHGTMPFGELAHGPKGVLDEHAARFGVRSRAQAAQMVRLASLKKRAANKERCPCGSGRRVGKCHNRTLNEHREKLGRRWFRAEHELLTEERKVGNTGEAARR